VRAVKAFIIACIAAVIIAIIGGLVLNSIQEPVDKAFSTSAVRLGT
jgi:energy-converting hydrogenase Eha subunit A